MRIFKNSYIKRILLTVMALCLVFLAGCTADFGFDQNNGFIQSGGQQTEEISEPETNEVNIIYEFRNKRLLEEHFEKHGGEFPYSTEEEYLIGANIMMANPNKLHKTEKEDGDDVYYLEETNEFIIVSKDGYLRTYFKPERGKKYFDKQ